MKAPKVIQVFEYETLKVGTRGFTEYHFELMSAYLEGRRDKYFQLAHRSIRFTSYVGVIQVQNLVIEVLPKAGKVSDKDLWRNVLIDMLKISGYLNVTATSDARLKLRKGSLLDLYYEIFLDQCRKLVSEGLSRQYIQQNSNRRALKGRLLFNDQLKHNLVRRERFVTAAENYTEDNRHNQVLFKALKILREVSGNPAHRRDTSLLLYQFDGVSDAHFNRDSFDRLKFNRTTERYHTPVWIAELIILNYLPDVRGGNRSVLAIMFPMEYLFENYVAKILKNASRGTGFKVETQKVERFWRPEAGRPKTVRPDILIDWTDDIGKRRVVLDTKWKMPGDSNPADGDLKQMFVYNKYFNAEASNLLYPTSSGTLTVKGRFLGDENGSCSMWHVPVLNTNLSGLNKELGVQIFAHISMV